MTDKTSEEYQPYSREEAEALANKKWTDTGKESNVFFNPQRAAYISGRMSLADKCKSLQSENEAMRWALEEVMKVYNEKGQLLSFNVDIARKALNQSPTKE